jgi:hypothetical protein
MSENIKETKYLELLASTFNELDSLFIKEKMEKELAKARELMSQNEFIKIYIGTTTPLIQDTLVNGIKIKTFHSEIEPNRNKALTVTNKWHYYDAYQKTNAFMKKEYGENWFTQKQLQWWLTGESLPCYFTCNIPKRWLLPDETYFKSNYIIEQFKNAMTYGGSVGLTGVESLKKNGTASIMEDIPVGYIESVTILGEGQLYLELTEESGTYFYEVQEWKIGKGMGFLTAEDLEIREMQSDLNLTVPFEEIAVVMEAINRESNKKYKG